MPTTPETNRHPLPIPRTNPATHLAVRAVAWTQSRHAGRATGDRGQATAEYGLVILAAGGIALGVIAWASRTNSFTNLFTSVVRKLTSGL